MRPSKGGLSLNSQHGPVLSRQDLNLESTVSLCLPLSLGFSVIPSADQLSNGHYNFNPRGETLSRNQLLFSQGNCLIIDALVPRECWENP